MKRGFSLLELVGALTLVSLGASVLLPAARRLQERLAVLAAREELVGLIVRARGRAVLHGGSVVVLEEQPPAAWIVAGDSIRESVATATLRGAELLVSGGSSRVELRFDGMGLGQMAARSVTVQRGGAVARLVISAYGRIRRE